MIIIAEQKNKDATEIVHEVPFCVKNYDTHFNEIYKFMVEWKNLNLLLSDTSVATQTCWCLSSALSGHFGCVCHPRTHLCDYLNLYNLQAATMGYTGIEKILVWTKPPKVALESSMWTFSGGEKAQVKRNLKNTSRPLWKDAHFRICCKRLCCFMRYLQQQKQTTVLFMLPRYYKL